MSMNSVTNKKNQQRKCCGRVVGVGGGGRTSWNLWWGKSRFARPSQRGTGSVWEWFAVGNAQLVVRPVNVTKRPGTIGSSRPNVKPTRQPPRRH